MNDIFILKIVAIAIAFTSIVGWSLYLRSVRRDLQSRKMPRVSDLAVKVANLALRDFIRLSQEARELAKQKHGELYGHAAGAMLETQLVVLPLESSAASNKHAESGVGWQLEYNPNGVSFVTIFGGDENLRSEVRHYLWHLIANRTGIIAEVVTA